MELNYENLKYAAENKNLLGVWKGKDIYSISKMELAKKERQSGPFVIYDENNKLYLNGNIVGVVTSSGYVHELTPYSWIAPSESKISNKKNANSKEEVSKPVSRYNFESGITFDNSIFTRINKEVDCLLEKACKWDR